MSAPAVGTLAISQQPTDQAVTAGQTATFTVAATGQMPITYQWLKNGKPISGATSASYTTPATTLADNSTQFQASVSDPQGQESTNTVSLLVRGLHDVSTFHNDNFRTGQTLAETTLTLQNVTPATFGKLAFLATDGKVDAQPLYLDSVAIPGQGTHNVLYVASEHDSVYAFDADTQALLWQTSLLGAGETTSDDRGCDGVVPEIGVTSTPVIDRSRGSHGVIYLVAATEDDAGGYHFRIHALDLASGTETLGGPVAVQAQYTAQTTNFVSVFDPAQYLERAALVLANGMVYTTWASHCDANLYYAWVISYDAATLQQTGILNFTPNGEGGGIWMSGDGPAVDSDGNIYLLDGNGTFDDTLDNDGNPNKGDFGNALVKISGGTSMSVTDYFAPHDTDEQTLLDHDLGSGGALLLPDQVDSAGKTWHLVLGSGKTGYLYVVDRDNMGKFNSSTDNVHQVIPVCCSPQGGLYGPVYSTPAYFNSNVYFGAKGGPVQAFAVANGELSSAYTMISTNALGSPGATPSISANGTSNAILWLVENGTIGVLHAYDATNLSSELYNSNLMGARDQFAGNKFIVPTVANGSVFVGTPTGVAVFGLLPQPGQSSARFHARRK